VEIDARPSALQRALGPQLLSAVEGGLVRVGVGMKASTPYGEGRVVGVARGDVWCVGAWGCVGVCGWVGVRGWVGGWLNGWLVGVGRGCVRPPTHPHFTHTYLTHSLHICNPPSPLTHLIHSLYPHTYRYALASEGGKIWYWSREELEVLVASGRVTLHPLPLPLPIPLAAATATAGASGISSGTGGGGGGGVSVDGSGEEEGGRTPAAPAAAAASVLPTRALFTALLSSSSSSSSSSSPSSASSSEAGAGARGEWSLEEDEALVRLVNAAASKMGLPAAHHLGRAELVAALQSQVRGWVGREMKGG
jgi:hypothetical protein